MSLVVVSPWYPSASRPVSGEFVRREVSALKGAGADVRVVVLDRDLPSGFQRQEIREETRVLRIGMNPSNPFSVAKAAGPLTAALSGADLVHSHAISALPVLALARSDAPWVHSEHWSALSSPASAGSLLRVVRPLFGALLRLPDVVISESRRLEEAVLPFRGGRRTAIVPCIVPGVTVREAPRRRANTAHPHLRLVSTGGVIARKNPLLAVRTVAELVSRGVPASLLWIGEGDQKDEARALAAELGVEAEFGGGLPPEEVQRELSEADVFIAPTQGENFFVAAAEALVAGRPIVASDKGGHVEYADPRFSEIVSEQTPEAYADAVQALMARTQDTSAREIAETVAGRFSPASVAEQLQDLYRDLVVERR